MGARTILYNHVKIIFENMYKYSEKKGSNKKDTIFHLYAT